MVTYNYQNEQHIKIRIIKATSTKLCLGSTWDKVLQHPCRIRGDGTEKDGEKGSLADPSE